MLDTRDQLVGMQHPPRREWVWQQSQRSPLKPPRPPPDRPPRPPSNPPPRWLGKLPSIGGYPPARASERCFRMFQIKLPSQRVRRRDRVCRCPATPKSMFLVQWGLLCARKSGK